ncbi:EAL and modified HD-GYP domain-containing signal transduction protein [Natronospira proteinivora]|uniref:EAL and modified HD-GYP domain-containing signal transduction protein n=1 Tax=Natronospira proteinivora TaxID=1807133 RepID=A0ABT1G6F5_9GAMM|nr:HDOD domain-containing protein [Natronospira proteinivora]MCP1726883.1 EAL and modified HD-GYP domain-containing signal transduction protein [Natronospira proteinivora]
MESVFVARQPIFNRKLQLYAYELLFRSGIKVSADFSDGDAATSEVILNTFTVFGLDELVGKAPAFINLTRRFLVQQDPLPLPQDRTVIEILEDVVIDEELIRSVERRKREGYTIALDDFFYTPQSEPLLEMVDIVKLEVPTLLDGQAPSLIEHLKRFNLTLVAEKIENQSQLDHCRELGCDYFQGYFLSRPDISSGTRLSSERIAMMELLGRLHDPEADILDLESVISKDLALSYKLLRYINSAYYRRAFEIRSLRQAVMMLGMRELRRWASIVSLSQASEKPEELINQLLVRAKMCELIAEEIAPDYSDVAFIAGLFSGLDALLNCTMEEALEKLPLAAEIRQALLEREGPVGEFLGAVLAYENADSIGLNASLVTPDRLRERYLAALQWQQRQSTLI